MLSRWFLSHPAALGETYFQHMDVAAGFGVKLLGAGLACLVHAVIPCLFERTGSTTIRLLNDRLAAGRGCAQAVRRAA